MRVTLKSKISTLRANAVNHVVNKSIPLSFIKVSKKVLTFDADGNVEKAQESAVKKWPMLPFQAKTTDNPNQRLDMVIYGDAVNGLITLPAEDTGDDLLFVAEYDHTKDKWSASTALLENSADMWEASQSKPSQGKSLDDMTFEEMKELAKAKSIPTRGKTEDQLYEALKNA